MECQSLLPGRNKKHRAKSHEFTLKVRKTPASELASRQPNSMHDKGRYRSGSSDRRSCLSFVPVHLGDVPERRFWITSVLPTNRTQSHQLISADFCQRKRRHENGNAHGELKKLFRWCRERESNPHGPRYALQNQFLNGWPLRWFCFSITIGCIESGIRTEISVRQ